MIEYYVRCEIFIPNVWSSISQIKHLMGIKIVSEFREQIETLISTAAAIDENH